MKSLFLLVALHGANCDQLAQQKDHLQAQWNFMAYASSGMAPEDLDDIPLRQMVIRSIKRYNRLCQ